MKIFKHFAGMRRHGKLSGTGWSFVVLSIALTLVSTEYAPAQNPEPPPPREPVLHRLPDYASWTVSFKYQEDEDKPGEAGQAGVQPLKANPYVFADQAASVSITKTGNIWWEQTTWLSGLKTESWIFNSMRAGMVRGPNRIVAMPFSYARAEAFDYRREDFEGLGWVSLSNYTGVKNYLGKPAYVFVSNPSTAGNEAKAGRTAILSIEDQWPLYFRDGTTERTYTYNPAPSAPLVPPDKIMKIFNKWKAANAASQRIPGRP